MWNEECRNAERAGLYRERGFQSKELEVGSWRLDAHARIRTCRVRAGCYTERMSAVGVYVHLPFCHHRCTYCDFNIYAGMRSLYERYARAVAKEIVAVRGRPPTAPDADRRSPPAA